MKKILCTNIFIILFSNCFSQINESKVNYLSKPIKRLETTLDTIALVAKISEVAPMPTFARQPMSTEVGFTQGELNVNLTGAATYNIPLKVPPGINGVVPQISLNYNSQGGNGIAGYGWNIGGLSSITKIASTKFHDDLIDPVDFDASDRYAFDGQRLMLKTGTVYGAAENVYETENFSNVKITSVGTHPNGSNYGPASFLVEYPDGSTANYATTSLTEWAITYWQNAQGVRINYTYTLTNNVLSILRITYGSTYDTEPINNISFQYVSRLRPEEMYIGGQFFKEENLLERISIGSDINAYDKSYQLIHNKNTLNYQRLISITENAVWNLGSLNPTTFNYDDSATTINYNTTTTTGIPFNDVEIRKTANVAGDFNGDGKIDAALYPIFGPDTNKWISAITNIDGSAVNIGATLNLTTPFVTVFPTNYITYQNKLSSSDGITIIQPTASGGSIITNYYYSSASIGLFPQNVKNIGLSINNRWIDGDFNGDGITDLVSIGNNGSVAFVNLDMRDTSTFDYSTININVSVANNIKTGDFNGDGKTDLMVFYEGSVNIYSLRVADKQIELIASYGDSEISISTYKTILLGDFNGDGKTDFLIPHGHNSVYWRKFTATGTTFLRTFHSWSDVFYSVPNYLNNYTTFVAQDIDNDGKSDLLSLKALTKHDDPNYGKLTVKCMPNINGDITSGTVNSYIADTGFLSGLNKWALPIFYNSKQVNRKLEVGFILNNKIHYFQSNKDFNEDKLLRSITDGNENIEVITYKPLIEDSINNDNYDNPNVYFPTVSNFENYPNFDIQIAPTFQVVKKIEKQGADYNSYKKKYFSYYGAVSNLEGLGFFGFRGTTQTNWHTGDAPHTMISNVSRNDISLRGANVENYSAINWWNPTKTLSSMTNYVSRDITTYNIINATGVAVAPLQNNKVFKLFANKIENFNGLQGTNSETKSTFDVFNNPTQVTTNIKSGTVIQKTNLTTLTYQNTNVAGSTYIIGRPLSKIENATIYPTTADQDIFKTGEFYTYTNNLLTKIRKRGNGTKSIYEENEYDIFGNITKKTIHDGEGLIAPRASARIFTNDDQESAAAPINSLAPRITTFDYMSAEPFNGRFLTDSIDVEGLGTAYFYDARNGNLLYTINPYNLDTTFYHDGFFKPTKVIDYLGKTKTITYTREGINTKITTTSSVGGDAPTEVILDCFNREIRTGTQNINNDWVYVSKEYDIINQLIKTSEPYTGTSATLWNETVFDSYGRVIKTISSSGKETTITYGIQNLTVETFDGIKTQSVTKNAMGDIVSSTDTPGGTITNKYFANGNLKSSTYDNGATTTITQDIWGRKTSLNDPSAGLFTYEYNLYGEMTKESNPNGSTFYKYDGFGKLLKKTISGINGDSSVTTNTYDDAGSKLLIATSFQDVTAGLTTNYTFDYDQYKRPNFSDESGTIAYFQKAIKYDDFGRVSNELSSAINAGNSSQRSDKWVNYNYKNGFAYQIKDGLNGTGATLWQLDTVNKYEQVLTATLGNGVIIANQYDNFGRPTQYKHDKTVTNVMTLNNTFDPNRGLLFSRNNNIFGTGVNLWSEDFSNKYDSNDRLTSYKNQNAAYVTQSYTTNGNININDIGTFEYENSNPPKPFQASAFTAATPALLSFYQNREQNILYNAVKKPIRISENNQEIIDFDYNLNGQRSTMYYGDSNANKLARPFIKSYAADGSMEIRRNNLTNTIEFITYIGGDAYGAPLLLKTDGTISTLQNYLYLHRDYQGSILAITDNTGVVKEKRLFDAWGSLIKYWNATSSNIPTIEGQMLIDRGYTGHEHLVGVGLINMNGRLYDPAMHRFLSPDNNLQDPLNTQNYNRYSYVLNNPLNNTDPSGEDCVECPPGWNTPNWNNLNSIPYDPRGKEVSDAWINKNVSSLRRWGKKNINSFNNFIDRNSTSIGNDIGNSWDKAMNWLGFGNSEKVPPAPAYNISLPKQIGMFDSRTSSLVSGSYYGSTFKERYSNPELWKDFGHDLLFGYNDPNMISASVDINQASMFMGGGGSIKGISYLKNIFKVEQYSLRAVESGFYPVMKRGFAKAQSLVWLEKGEVWKFGTTRNPFTRYTQKYLSNRGEKGLYYFREFEGTLSEALKLEKMKIMNFFEQNGFLPWGNKIAK